LKGGAQSFKRGSVQKRRDSSQRAENKVNSRSEKEAKWGRMLGAWKKGREKIQRRPRKVKKAIRRHSLLAASVAGVRGKEGGDITIRNNRRRKTQRALLRGEAKGSETGLHFGVKTRKNS